MKQLILRLLKVPPEPIDPMGDHDQLLVFRAAENYFKYKLVLWAIGQVFTVIGMLVGLGFAAAFTTQAPGWLIPILVLLEIAWLVFIIVQGVFSFFVLRLDYEMRWYKVTDRALRIREGIWQVREMTMTFANIQNISTTQGPLQRALGIADLQVQTAGGGGAAQAQEGQNQPGFFNMHTGYFRGVDNAEQIRDVMRQRLREYRDSGLGDTDESPEPVAAIPAAAPASSPDMLAALRALREEMGAFRASAQALAKE
ncbi:PH domain-containing protein [bacterium]|nr:PH domain-containing protein [bacterium]